MNRNVLRKQIATAVAAVLALPSPWLLAQTHATGVSALEAAFRQPPPSARPMVRWWWFGPSVTKPEILRELQQMKADGIGGAELAFVYPEELDDPTRDIKNLRFLSPEHLDAIRYAQQQGRALGMRIDVTLCSGWPYGGPHISLNQAAARLLVHEVEVVAGTTTITTPKLAEGDVPLRAFLVQGAPKTWTAAGAVPLEPNHPDFAPASAERTALFFYMGHTRQQVKRAAVGTEGYVLDPFSHDAVAQHLDKVGLPLLSAFGGTPPYAIFSDSLEAYGADWTPDLPEAFQKQHGYDLLAHLPELYRGGTPEAAKVRHDWGRTLKELIDQNYLTQINNWALAHHTKFRSQTYGEPAVSFTSQHLAGLPEGEGPQWRSFSTLRWASSGNHVFGNNVTSGETFTWLHSPVFRATPLDMKAEADIDFIMGENQLVFHGWPYSPPQADIAPGWSLYAAANFNDNNPWHPLMPAVDAYITRLSFLMRQGKPANQVAILLPTDDAWAAFAPGKVTVTGAMQTLVPQELMEAILAAGYNIDFIDADAIDSYGLAPHELLILPPTDRIPVKTLEKIGEWRRQHPDLSPRPQPRDYNVLCYQRCPSIDPEGKPLPGMTGSFLVEDNLTGLVKDMQDAVTPDFKVDNASDSAAVGFIRRKLPNADIYFIANTSNRTIETTVVLKTAFTSGEELDPESGKIVARSLSPKLTLHLAPYASKTLLFASHAAAKPESHAPGATIADLSNDWDVTFVATGKTQHESTPVDWTKSDTTRHYSGEAVYKKHFNLSTLPAAHTWLDIRGGKPLPGAPTPVPEHAAHDPSTLGKDGLPNPVITKPGPGMHAFFEPPVREAALVIVNGKAAGGLWHPPYRLDLSPFLQTGENEIEIHVFNTALNAWSALPPHDYGPLKAKYGDRFQVQDLDKVKPEPSGIVGTIQLVTGDSE